MTRTIINFQNNAQEAMEIVDDQGRPIDPIDVTETLEEINNRLGHDFYRPAVHDVDLDGEDVTVITLLETEDSLLNEETVQLAQTDFDSTLADKGWYSEEVEPDTAEKLDTAMEAEDDPEEFEDDEEEEDDLEDYDDSEE